MGDTAATMIRAYPMPPVERLDPQLHDRLKDSDGEVYELDGVGLVLVIDDHDGATDGIHAYDELIAELHQAGLNVFAENLDNPHGTCARRELWRVGQDGYGWLIHPNTRAPLLAITNHEAARNATAHARELLAIIAEIPAGLLEAGYPAAPYPYFEAPIGGGGR